MRAFLLISLSTVALTGCLTTQSNPNYEQSVEYRNAPVATQQYASAPVTSSAVYTEPAYSQEAYGQGAYSQPAYSNETYAPAVVQAGHDSTSAYPEYAQSAPVFSEQDLGVSPTDSAYESAVVTGTPGFMAMQAQTGAASPSAQADLNVNAAGTPVAYDLSQNLITADALTTGQQEDTSVRLLQGAGQNYTVRPGDTVYSLSRKTCVGVNVIQSMNGIGSDYAIQIGQPLTLPSSVC